MQAHLSFKPDLPEERHAFGPLITLDDAILKPGAKGFGLHPHQDVEVVTFVVQGEIKHIDPNHDSHSGTLAAKGVQVITAGTGIVHNEENNAADKALHALQIWFKPRKKGITPSYSKKPLQHPRIPTNWLVSCRPMGKTAVWWSNKRPTFITACPTLIRQ